MVSQALYSVSCSTKFDLEPSPKANVANLELPSQPNELCSHLVIPTQLLTQFFQNTPIPLATLKLVNRSIINVNESCLKALGYERFEIVNHNILELGLLTETRTFELSEEKLKAGLSVPAVEQRLKTKTGAIKTYLVSAEPFVFFSEPLALVSLLDISDKKRTKEQFCQALQASLKDAESFTQLVMQKLAEVSVNVENDKDIVDLTPREKQVLELMAQGHSNHAIGNRLGLAPHTVRNYVTQIYEKLNLHSRSEAIVWARERGLLHST